MLIILAILCLFLAYELLIRERLSIAYLASDNKEVVVYDKDANAITLIRGQKVKASNKYQKINDSQYRKIYFNDETYYINDDFLVNNKDNAVLEKTLTVYRTCSVYQNEKGSKLSGLAYKGDVVNIEGHTSLNKDGTVDRYKTNKGYILSKYLTNDESLLNKTTIFSNDHNNPYGGGSPSELDYVGNEKKELDGNIMPTVCKALYINAEAIKNIEDYIKLAKETSVNTFVIDIRDAHIVSYKSDIMQEYSPSSYKAALYTKEEFKEQINKVKDADIYIVGRITVFKDKLFMIDHPEYAIVDLNDNGKPFEFGNSYWPSPFERDVWEYNIEIAKEAVKDFGFNEIEFDYVRFPEQIDYYADYLNALDLKNKYNETRSQAIQRFLMYAVDELHEVNAYVSADVFGETSNNYVTAYGQYWPAISSIVDVISPMPYPDHFSRFSYDLKEVVWTVPYKLLSAWGKEVKKMQDITPHKAKIRTFIQGYDATKDPYVAYDNQKLIDQINALIDSEIYDNGYIVWNAGSSLDRYYLYKDALSK